MSMMEQAPITAQQTVELVECGVPGVREAKVLEEDTSHIEWDRFMRLSATAERVRRLPLNEDSPILDVGGFDGAFAVLVPRCRVWVIDPRTTGGSGLAIPFPDRHFEVVVSIDALEHLPREVRPTFLRECLRVTRSTLFVNFPEARSMEAQRAALSLTENAFIREHVEHRLPTRKETVSLLKKIRPDLTMKASSYVNVQTWLAWFVLFHTNRERGMQVSAYLKDHVHSAGASPHLYDLLECTVS